MITVPFYLTGSLQERLKYFTLSGLYEHIWQIDIDQGRHSRQKIIHKHNHAALCPQNRSALINEIIVYLGPQIP